MKRIFTVPALLFSLLTSSTITDASELGLDMTSDISNTYNRSAYLAELTLGWSFTINELAWVDGLGFFDDHTDDGPGLRQDHLVSLWNDAGDLLAMTTITNSSTVVASDAPHGNWLFNDITPILLAEGNYILGALDPECTGLLDCDVYSMGTSTTSSPIITFIEARSGTGFPDIPTTSRNDGYFGPNLSFGAVPVPAAVWLFGTALVGLAGIGSRRKAT